MPLEQKDFESIEIFLKQNLPRILADQSLGKPPAVYEIELRERMVRVEEELRNQRELMKQGFEMMDKRFEQVDRRLKQVDNRFDEKREDSDMPCENIDNSKFTEMSVRMRNFMILSFGLFVTSAGIIIAMLKL